MNTCVDTLRRFNRFYTKHTGLLQPYLPGGKTTLSEARILLEIGYEPGITAAELGRRLAMDRGQLSRILQKLVKEQLVRKDGVPSGRKPVPLALTKSGADLLRELEQNANNQARAVLAPLDETARARLIAAMQEIERTFQDAPGARPEPPVIRTGRAGDLGWMLMRHGQLYAQEYGFDTQFEHYVMQGMLPFAAQADQPGNELWIAELGGAPAGSIAIMRAGTEKAQLRWFLVEPEARGCGLGKQLLCTALDFCRDQNFARVFLLTIDILPAARHLYESFGFRVENSVRVSHWGQTFSDERWELQLAAD